MHRTTPQRSRFVLLTALAVLLGVLGMHAVSGGPHAPGRVDHSTSPSMAQPSVDPSGGQPARHGPVEDVVTAVSATWVQVDPPAGLVMAMAAMCVAVMLGLVVLALRSSRRAQGPGTYRQPRVTVPLLRQPTRAPPPDLLTRLCVLRA